MRIAAVTTWYPSGADRVEGVFVARHVEALRGAGHDVRVLHLGTRPAPDEPGVRHLPVDRRDPRSVLAAVRAVAEHARDADLLHTHVFSTLLYVPPRLRTPWLHSEHWSGVSDPTSGGPVWNRLAAARRLLARPTAVTAVSSYLADAVRPFRRDRTCHVVPNVVPAPRTATPPTPGSALRVLSVGNLRPVKDPLLAVAAVAELRRRGHDARLRWVGGGPLETATRERAAELRVPLELLGRLAPGEFAGEWAACDVFLLPSEYETFCVAGAEALAHGRPAVLGARGGMNDFRGPGVHLVARRTPQAFADAVESAAAGRLAPEVVAAPVRRAYSPGTVAAAFAPVLTGTAGRTG